MTQLKQGNLPILDALHLYTSPFPSLLALALVLEFYLTKALQGYFYASFDLLDLVFILLTPHTF